MDYFTQRPLRNSDIVWRREQRKEERVLRALEEGEAVDEQGTVLLVVSGTMHQLNLVGGMIWCLCDGTRTVDEITAQLADEFSVSRDELESDVREFFDELQQRGWLSYV
ncbi:MAG: pyrroloquinoline quinone biosynthesis peptide chaperone PqqD [Desulfuromonadales bacterium]|nr:pyrroloquinoline quinone biosynthesis peptide chaperone PqqD [Desulfuromonadales bacterium]MDT8423851.1 pyrroloquinoline quinone biosynthesis peptide chaperone PqqD [Desulfuromonadales bacterium]